MGRGSENLPLARANRPSAAGDRRRVPGLADYTGGRLSFGNERAAPLVFPWRRSRAARAVNDTRCRSPHGIVARSGAPFTGEQQAAIDHYRAMLILNPNDNQGIRYLLASALLQRDDLAGLKVLLRQYEGDGSAAWAYTLALIAYREQDPRGPAIVREAWESNSHVPAMLAGLKRLVPSRDGYISMGGEDEATAYVEENGAAWRAIPGAIDWLAERSTGLKPRHRGCQS
jgi:hypothetical protein